MKPQILALTSDGRPHQFLSWEDSVTLKYKDLIQFELGDDENTFYGGTSRMTGERSSISVKSIIAIKGKFKHTRKQVALTNHNLFRRDLNTCGYCGRFFVDEKLTRDHIMPKSRGGKDTWTNVIAACKKCNNHKDNKTPDEAGMELIWVPYQPVREEQLIMSNRHILADQAEFILNFVPQHSRMHQYVNRLFS